MCLFVNRKDKMKKIEIFTAVLSLLLLVSVFSSCSKEAGDVRSEIKNGKTVKLSYEYMENAYLTFKGDKGYITKREAKEGELLILDVVVKEGFEVREVKVNNQNVEIPYQFVLGQEAPKIDVVVKEKVISVDLSRLIAENGVVTFKKGDEVVTKANKGDKLMLSVVANEGFILRKLKFNGEFIDVPKEIVLGAQEPSLDAYISKPTLVKFKYTDMPSCEVIYKRGDEIVTEATEGEELIVDIKAKKHYFVRGIMVGSELVKLPYKIILGSEEPIFSIVVEEVKLLLSEKVNSQNARVIFKDSSASPVYFAKVGETLMLEVIPDDDYVVESVTFEGEFVTLPYQFSLGEEAPNIKVVMKKIS